MHHDTDDQPSGLGWLPSGELLVVAMLTKQVRRVDPSGTVHVHADLTAIAEGDCNDMVVDGRGNAYVGNFVKSGNPNGGGLPPWHEFGAAPRAYLNIVTPDHTTTLADPAALKLDLVAASAEAALIQK